MVETLVPEVGPLHLLMMADHAADPRPEEPGRLMAAVLISPLNHLHTSNMAYERA